MKLLKIILFPCLLAGMTQTAFTQTSLSDSTQKTNHFQVKISLNYNTALNYYGRTDSLKSSGFFPLAELWITPKFYVNAAPVFVNNTIKKFDYAGTVTTVGYQNITRKWITSIYFLKPFYKQSSELVQSALKAQSGVGTSFLTSILNISISGDIKFSDRIDFGASAGVDHLIRIQNEDKSVLVIDPAFYVYTGSQNFQRSYYKKGNAGFLNYPATNQLVTEDVQQFTALSYEASLPLVYAKKKWMFIATPAYVLPQNLIKISARPDLSEQGEKMFYATLTAKYTF